MDLAAALRQVPTTTALCDNLDPAGVFCQSSPEEAHARATDLLAATAAHRNYVFSSGCDIPPNAKLANLDAFYEALRGPRAPATQPLAEAVC